MTGDGSGIPAITARELERRLDDGEELVLVDVRERFEREIADLPDRGQLRIPVGEFERRADELDPSDSIVLYCRSGARSGWATSLLLERGYDSVLNLEGGVLAWREHVDPSLQAY